MVSTSCRAMRSTGLSEVIGSWNTMAMPVAAQLAQLGGLMASTSRPWKRISPADDAGRLLEQPHQRQRRDAFAGSGFADDAERLAGGDREAHAIDGAHHARRR